MHNSAVTIYDATSVVISVINHKGYYTATTASTTVTFQVLSSNILIILQMQTSFQIIKITQLVLI